MAYKNGVIVGPVSFTGGTASIGTDATDNAINVGTAASAGRTTTVGNTTGTSATNLNSGSGVTTGTNADITLSPDGTGTVSVTAAPIVPTTDRADSLGSTTNSWDNVYCDGVSFDDGTNVLDTYTASAAWTPVLDFGGASVGITYSTQTALFCQVGDLKFINISITLTSKGTSTGTARISGLPAASTVSGSQPIGGILYANITFTGEQLTAGINGSNIFITNCISGSASANLTNTNLADNTTLRIMGTYI